MTLHKFFESIVTLLIIGIFVWTLYYIISYDDYYYGEPLKRLEVVVKEKPKFFFDGEAGVPYYFFTIENYKTEFRISEGAVELVRNSDSLTNKIEAIKSGDSVRLEIRQRDSLKLISGSQKIRVIGLSVKGKKFFDHIEVQKTDKGNKADRWFGYFVFFGILLFIIVRGHNKRRKQNRAAIDVSE